MQNASAKPCCPAGWLYFLSFFSLITRVRVCKLCNCSTPPLWPPAAAVKNA
jgi:hypothetical protein